MPQRETSTIIQRFNNAEDNVQKRHSEWKEYWKLYKSATDGELPTISQITVPMIFRVIETLMPRIVSAITGSNPMVSTEPRSPDDVASAKVLEALHQYQLSQMEFEKTIIPIVRDALIFDIGIGKLQWVNDRVGEGVNEVTRYRGPKLDYVSPFSIFPDPHAKNRKDAQYIMHRYWVDKETLKSWEKQAKVGDLAGGKPVEEISTGQSPREDEDAQQIKLNTVGRTLDEDHTRDWVQIIEYWEDDWVQYVANESTLIRDEENPYDHGEKPFHFFADYPQGDSLFGQGEVENIVDLQKEVNIKRNQRIDKANLTLNPPLMVSPSAMVDEEELVFGPYQTWTVDPDDISVLNFPDVRGPAIEEEQMAKQDINQTTSITSVVQGASTQSQPDTATGFRTLNENATSRFTLKVRSFEHPIEDMATQMHQLNMQFLNQQSAVRIVGDTAAEVPDENVEENGRFKFLQFSPDEISGDFDFKARGARSETLRQRQQRMVQILQSIGPIASEVNVKEIIRELMKSFGIEDTDRFLKVTDEQLQRLGAKGKEGGGQGANGRAQEGQDQQRGGEKTEGRGASPQELIRQARNQARTEGQEQSQQLGAQEGG